MATEVSLKELGDHLRDALGCVDKAVDSAESEPELNFSALRKSLSAALELLGGEGSSGGAADAALRGHRSGAAYHGVAEIFAGTHPYRNVP